MPTLTLFGDFVAVLPLSGAAEWRRRVAPLLREGERVKGATGRPGVN